jgi:2-amino-4-hydroxy-6-hydroxymethyldihydropteridine diphosphokinase
MARCAIAIGSNLGNSLQIVTNAVAQLNAKPELEIIDLSRWYRTKAVTKLITRDIDLTDSKNGQVDQAWRSLSEELNQTEQPDFINGCAIVETNLSPLAILAILLDLEKQFGRQRRQRWDARTLDLDLLLYGDLVLDLPELILPHPRMGDRAFVMLPLAEIAPNWRHPVVGKTIAELAIDPPDLDICKPVPLEPELDR